MPRARSRRLVAIAASLLSFHSFARTASAADLWGVSDWGTLVWGGGAAPLPALGGRELLLLAAVVLSTGIFLARRMLKRNTGEER